MKATLTARQAARAMAGQSELEAVGAAIIDSNALDDLLAIVRPDQFLDDRARAILETLLRLRSAGVEPSMERLAAELEPTHISPDVLVEFMDSVPHGFHVEYHAQQVRRAWRVRQWADSVDRTARLLNEPAADEDEALSRHINNVEHLLDSTADASDGDGQIGELLLRFQDEPEVEAIETGLFDLDVLLGGGFCPGQMIVIGARPSVGKSALCGGFALSAARSGIPALYVFWESSLRQAVQRFQQQANARLSDADAINAFASAPLYARAAAGWSIDKLEAEVRRYVRRYGVRFVVVDYLSLVTPRDRRLPRHEQVADVSRSLQRLALTTGVVMVAAQQLSRDVEKRASEGNGRGKQDETARRVRPRMSDFRESGSVEQDADVLIAIDRPVRAGEGDRTKASLHVLKNRNGETGVVDVKYAPQRTLFHSE